MTPSIDPVPRLFKRDRMQGAPAKITPLFPLLRVEKKTENVSSAAADDVFQKPEARAA
jgi:hypothetical protein